MILDTKEKTRSLSQYSSTSSLASDNTRTTDSVSRVQQASRSHLSINKTTSELEAPPDYFPNTPYGTSPGAGPSSSSSSSNSRRTSYVGPSLPPASNFTLIDRPRSAIKGVYVVDPSLCIPDSVLPPLEEGQTVRPNLKLKGYHSSVDVDVHLILPADAKNVPERVVIEIESYHASTTVRLYNMLPIPVTLKASSTHSSVKVYLPRSFRGLIEQSVKHGKSTLSEHVARVTRTYSEVKGKSVSFMGDPAGEGWDSTGQHWLGSTVTMSTSHSNAGIWYVDELERKKTEEGENRPNVLRKRGISGLFGRG